MRSLLKRLLTGFISLAVPSFVPRTGGSGGQRDFEDARFDDDAHLTEHAEIGIAGMTVPKTAKADPQRRATQSEIDALERQLDQKKFVHYLGKFSGMQLDINQHSLTMTSNDITPADQVDSFKAQGKPVMRFHPARHHTCAHFTVEYGDTVYVFWNNPSDTQRAIHNELQRKVEKRGETSTSTHVDLIDSPTGGDFRAHIVPVETYVDNKLVAESRTERPVFQIQTAEPRFKARPETEVAPEIVLGSRWKPETGTAQTRPGIEQVRAPGFFGPTYD